MTLQDLPVDQSWTLFLDRDGVINRRLENDYVKTWDQFGFLPGVKESIRIFSGIFGRIIVVTNQQGVAKGLMTFDDVERIHELMLKEIQNQGGRIDSVIFSPHMANSGSVTRKPAVGMALHARKMFHDIRFCKSFMVGDSYSDMLFGKRTGMKTILIAEDPGLARKFPRLVDFHSTDLVSIARDLQSKNELLTL